VADLGMTRIILETDTAIMGRALASEEYDRSSNGGLFRKISVGILFNVLSLFVQDYVIL
jgi:hypothetical protein